MNKLNCLLCRFCAANYLFIDCRKVELDRNESYETFDAERKRVRVRQQLELFYSSEYTGNS